MANTVSAEPVASTATVLFMVIDGAVPWVVGVSWMLATTPGTIGFVFKPLSTQVRKPGAEAQDSVLPAAVAAGPAVAVMAWF
jgi:hypothetical protein